jgi:ER-bound oxygenase mpaB/B'/Rubber oxygenase, catalytic domain
MIDRNELTAAYRDLVLHTFPFEFKWAHATTLYRTFAVPRMAKLLVETGETERDTEKRQIDTGLLMYELFTAGFDSERGKEVIRAINRMHHRWQIENGDYVYTLAAFVVVPTRFIDQYGWRKTSGAERAVIAAWYGELGHLMGLRDLPDRYDDYVALFDKYEEENLAYSPEGARLMARTSEALQALFPPPIQPLYGIINRLLLGERLCRCLGLEPPGPAAQMIFDAVLAVRATIAGLGMLPARRPIFRPGRSAGSVYPGGYELSDLGVDAPRRSPAT